LKKEEEGKNKSIYMDFKGQELAEKIFYYLIFIFGVIGFVVGFILQDFGITTQSVGAGAILSGLIMIPDWPFFNKNPITWLSPDTEEKKKKKKGKNL